MFTSWDAGALHKKYKLFIKKQIIAKLRLTEIQS